MKPEQDPERNPSGDAAMKGRVTPVPPERPEDDRAKPADSASDEDVSRREALKGHLDPTADEQTPGDRARAERHRRGPVGHDERRHEVPHRHHRHEHRHR